MTATRQYCNMWTVWKRAVPETLAAENPSILSELLRLASREAGICRSELERKLDLNQPRISKLSKKLLDENWLEVVERPGRDGRLVFIRATSLAKSVMESLEFSLGKVSHLARPVGSRRRALILPSNRIGSLLDRVPLGVR
jgi:DNA-binding MarR family transcriptional regulator